MPDPAKDLSALLRSIEALADDSPEREALLERLRRQVADGTYEIDIQDLARRIVDDSIESH